MEINNPNIQTHSDNNEEDIVLALLEGLCDELSRCDYNQCRDVVSALALRTVESIRLTLRTL